MYGVIDIGSNTIRLMIYTIEDNQIKPLLNKKAAVGLAGYISKHNRLKKDGIQRAVEVLCEFREIIDLINIKEVFPFATASLRNIENTEEALSVIRERCGFDVRVLSGTEEAVFDYYGAICSVEMNNGLLVDIGGGSTELVFYANKEIVSTASLAIGSLNLYSRFVSNIIPTQLEIDQIDKEVLQQLQTIHLPDYPFLFQPICGVGGTARAVRKLLQDIKLLDAKEVEYKSQKLEKVVASLRKDPQKITKQLLKTEPERIHTFFPGVIILSGIANYYGSDSIVTSNYGVREGYLYYRLEERGELHGS